MNTSSRHTLYSMSCNSNTLHLLGSDHSVLIFSYKAQSEWHLPSCASCSQICPFDLLWHISGDCIYNVFLQRLKFLLPSAWGHLPSGTTSGIFFLVTWVVWVLPAFPLSEDSLWLQIFGGGVLPSAWNPGPSGHVSDYLLLQDVFPVHTDDVIFLGWQLQAWPSRPSPPVPYQAAQESRFCKWAPWAANVQIKWWL